MLKQENDAQDLRADEVSFQRETIEGTKKKGRHVDKGKGTLLGWNDLENREQYRPKEKILQGKYRYIQNIFILFEIQL